MSKVWTIGALIQWTQQYFQEKGIDTPRLDAEILLAHVMKVERIYLYAHYDEPLEQAELAAYRELVKQRASRLSVAHILGTKSFMGLDFSVSTDVLIPRPETEVLVEQVLAAVKPDQAVSILDLGTGSGAILVSLLKYLPEAEGTGVDVSPKALAMAEKNGRSLGLAERLHWLEGDLFQALPDKTYDWIVSNPPYLTEADMQQLQPEVENDPPLALFGGIDGLDFYRRIAQGAWHYLAPGGRVVLEIGAGQDEAVQHVFMDTERYDFVDVVADYGKINRVLIFKGKE